MSSSSTPEPPHTPQLDIAEIEATERALTTELRHAEGALGESGKLERSGRWTTTTLAAPGTLFLIFYLVAPVVMLVLVSFWTQSTSGFDKKWTLDNYDFLFSSGVYWSQLKQTFFNSAIVVGATLILGFPVAYYLALKVQSMRNQVALFLIAMAPFLTSYLIRAVAWRYPLMGREGAVNTILQKIGFIDEPLEILAFSNFSVVLAMIQLYVLFMVTPLFFMLAQVDRSSLEAARDLGGSWFKTFREVVIPQISPGIVIGSIFIFVLAMGEYGTVRVVGGGNVSSIGTYIRNLYDNVQFPNAATSSVFLVLVMMIGVFVLLRFSNLREEL